MLKNMTLLIQGKRGVKVFVYTLCIHNKDILFKLFEFQNYIIKSIFLITIFE
jgi:hypothetical protein